MVITITMKNVSKRGENYHFRMAVPKDCQESIGQTSITQSLKTTNPATAATLAEEFTSEWKQKFKEARGTATPKTEPTKSKAQNEVAKLQKQLNNHLDKHWNDFVEPLTREELLEWSRHLRDCIISIHKGDMGGSDLTDILGIDYPLPAKHSPGIMRKLHRVLFETLIDLRQRIDTELGSEASKELDAEIMEPVPSLTPGSSPPINNSTTLTPQGTPPPGLGPSISEVLDECLTVKERTINATDAIRREVRILLEWLKLDADSTPISSITTKQIIDYRDNYLKKLLKNVNRMPETRDLTPQRQVAYCKKHGGDKIRITTLNNRLTNLGVLFSYAKKKHHVLYAVTEGLQLKNPHRQAKLSGAIFTGYSNEQMTKLMKYLEKHKGNHKQGKEWKYWIPLLLAYTGCRANEVAMLTTHDVKEENGIWYLDLRNNPDRRQRVKNAISARRVPICNTIVDLGFFDYVEAVKKKTSLRNNKERRLWPMLTYSEKGKWVRQLSHYFNKTIRPGIGAKDISSGLHGLRSSVCRALQRQSTEQRVIDELTGHQPEGISGVALGYQGRLELKVLAKALNKLSWEN